MMKEQIAKFIMGIFCILIVVVVAIRICFLRGQWINGLFCGHINKRLYTSDIFLPFKSETMKKSL